MKLSTAIRKGMKHTKKTTGKLFSEDGRAACALGCAYYTIGIKDNKTANTNKSYAILKKKFPILKFNIPVMDMTVEDAIIELNDVTQCSRENIARMVEKYERQLAKA